MSTISTRNDVLVSENLSKYQTARDFYREARDEMKENRLFYRGKQWSPEVKQYLQEQYRDVFVFNHIKPHVSAVVGMLMKNRTDPVARPVDAPTDTDKAVVMNAVLKSIYQENDIQFLEPDVLTSALVDSIGWYSLRVVAGDDYKLKIQVREEDSLNIMRDPNSVTKDLSDCEYLIKTVWIGKEPLKLLYPDKASEIERKVLVDDDDLSQVEHSSLENRLIDEARDQDYTDASGKNVRVIERWYWKHIANTYIHDKSTGKIYKAKADASALKALVKERDELEVFTRRDKELWVTTTTQNLLLEDKKYLVQNGMFPFVPMWCYKRSRDTWSIVTALKDYNREINKRRSTMTEGLANQVNAGWIAEEGSIDKEQWINNPQLRFVQGSLNRVREMKQPQISEGLLAFDRYMLSDMEDVGVSDASRGVGSGQNESGKVFNMKVNQSSTRIHDINDHIRYARKLLAENVLTTAQIIFTEERTIFVAGKDGEDAYHRINKDERSDITIGKWDIVIGEDKATETNRDYYTYLMMEVMRAMQGAGYPAQGLPWDLIIDGIDHPKKVEILDAVRKFMASQQMPTTGGEQQPPAPMGMPQQGGAPQQGASSMQQITQMMGGGGQQGQAMQTPQQFQQGMTGKQ